MTSAHAREIISTDAEGRGKKLSRVGKEMLNVYLAFCFGVKVTIFGATIVVARMKSLDCFSCARLTTKFCEKKRLAFCLIKFFVTPQEQLSLPLSPLSPLGQNFDRSSINVNLCKIKDIDVARSRGEAFFNIYVLLLQNIKSCNPNRRRQRKWPKKSNWQKNSLHIMSPRIDS